MAQTTIKMPDLLLLTVAKWPGAYLNCLVVKYKFVIAPIKIFHFSFSFFFKTVVVNNAVARDRRPVVMSGRMNCYCSAYVVINVFIMVVTSCIALFTFLVRTETLNGMWAWCLCGVVCARV